MKTLLQNIQYYSDKFKDVPRNKLDRLKYIFDKYKFKEKDIKTLQERLDILNDFNMYEEFSFIVYLVPQPSPRPRMVKGKHCYVFGANDDRILFERYLKTLGDKRPDLIVTPCELFLEYYLEIPKDMNKIEKALAELGYLRPLITPDFDNVAKKYVDMTQKTLLLNDSLVVGSWIQKYYSELPRIEIRLKYQKMFLTKYNKKKVESWSSYKEMKN